MSYHYIKKVVDGTDIYTIIEGEGDEARTVAGNCSQSFLEQFKAALPKAVDKTTKGDD